MTKIYAAHALAASRAPVPLPFSPSEWERIELAKPYFHEAGHAVVARLTGFPVAWVSVDPAFIDNNELAISCEVTNSGPVCMTISSVRVQPILDQGGIQTKDERDTIIGYVMHVLAGTAAEERISLTGFDPRGAQRDGMQAFAVIKLVSSSKRERKDLERTAMRRLSIDLDNHWDAVGRVAQALQQRRTLVAGEIDALIAGEAFSTAA